MSSTRSPAPKHANLYKLASPPTWKDSYRKRCSNRLKGSRAKLLQRYRDISDVDEKESACDPNSSIVDDVMREEWDSMQKEDNSVSNFNAVLETMDQIKHELILQEREILLQYDRMKELDDTALKNEINELENIGHKFLVICPICNTNYLEKRANVIGCACGLQINTQQDCITLEQVDIQLRVGATTHTEKCIARPVYGIIQDHGIRNLLMSCNACDFMFVVI